jgi:hypothetical protein
MNETKTSAAALDLVRAVAKFLNQAAATGAIKNAAGEPMDAAMLDAGLLHGAISLEVSVTLRGSGARVAVAAVDGDKRLRVLAMEGELGGVDTSRLN